jgi:uncharacterized protein (DUF4213/DUF364 family)
MHTERSGKSLGPILEQLPDGEIEQVQIGLRWTAVVSHSERGRRCGLASTRRIKQGHGRDVLPEAGQLHSLPAGELAAAILEHPHPLMHSVGLAAINSLLAPVDEFAGDPDAANLMAHLGAGRHVAVVGHFPFTEKLRKNVGQLDVLEKDPRAGDLPAEDAQRVLPECDVIAVTAMTLLNGSFETLEELFPEHATVIMLGPSTPLSPLMFEHGLDILAGSVVENVEAVIHGVAQSASYRQLHTLGIRKVMMRKNKP